ncbi:hypothetical protein Taro_028245 [Colocasia esculenta]|uniref:Uncharacterized protein n=1 Tax=Colocasia esculenta TaxID=4460 RepID=A0A843VKI5_COLES|nr:hypothetical protein [Colocasia esculenta]
MIVNRVANPEANMHTSGSISFATHHSRLEKEPKRPPTFQEVFDKTHKKKRTDQYISDRAREVAESYSQQMTEKYAEEEKQPQLDPETSAFTTAGAPGTSPSEMMGFIRDEISGLESRLAKTMESRLAQTMESRLVHMIQTQVSDAIQAQLSQALSQVVSQALS